MKKVQTKTNWISCFVLLLLCTNLNSQQNCEMYCAYTDSYFSVCSDCGEAIAADNCADAKFPSICNLDGFHFTTCGFTPDGPGGIPEFCGPGTIVHNNAWIGFTPGTSGRLHLNIEIVYCEISDQNCNGLQAAIARAQCRNPGNEFYGFGYESLDCVNCVDQSFDLISTDAIAGVPHYIMIDGCCGDVCDIIIHVIDGWPPRAWDLESETSMLCPSIAHGTCFSKESFASVVAKPVDGSLVGSDLLFEWYDQDDNLFYSENGASDGEGGLISRVSGINPETGNPYFCEDGITSVTVECFSKKSCCRESITFSLSEITPEPAETSFVNPDVTSLNCLNNQLLVKGNPVNPDVDILLENWQKVEFEGFPLKFKSIPSNTYNSNTSELSIHDVDPNNINRPDPYTGPGTYVYSFIDRNSNCVSEALICVPANTIPPKVILQTPNQIDCGNNTTVTLDASASEVFSVIMDCNLDKIKDKIFPSEETVPTDNFIVQWSSTSGNPIGNSDQLLAQVTMPGVYDCTIINNDNMCSGTASVIVTSSGNVPLVDLPEVVDIGCTMFVDLDATITSGGSGNLTYTWSNGNTVLGSGAQVTIDTPGTYTLTVIDNVSQCRRTETIEVIATDDGGPRIEPMTATDITCAASSSFIDPIITGDSNYSFSWLKDGNEIASTEDITVDSEGVYTIIVTDNATGCTSDQSIRVYLHQEIPKIIPFDDSVLNCANDGKTTVYATFEDFDQAYVGAISYEWYNSNGVLVGEYNFLEVTEEGPYTVKVINNFNGCTSEETLQVSVDDGLPLVEPLVADPLNCINQIIKLTGKGNTGLAAAKYEWLYNGEVISNTEDVEINEAGNYEFRITNLVNGCARSENVIVDENFDAPIANAGVQQELNCNETSVILDGSSSNGTGTLSYQWTGLNGTNVGSTMTANQAGTYTLTIIDQSNGCTSSSTVEVTENMDTPSGLTAEGSNLTCLDQTVSLNANSNSTNVSYEWISPNNTATDGQQIQANTAGTYTLVATNLENGCTIATTFELEQDLSSPEGLASTDGMIDCVNGAATLTASSITSNVSYEWISPGNVSTQGETLSASSAGTYTLIATNINTGCTSTTTSLVQANDDIPTLDISYLDGTSTVINCITSSSVLEGITDNGITIQWQDANNNVFTENPITVFEPGQYILTATNPINLCESEMVFNITTDFDEPQVEAVVSNDNITCQISEIEISAFDVNGNSNEYEWVDSNGNLITNSANYTLDQEGVYTVIATAENGCTSETTITIGTDTQEPDAYAAEDFTLNCNENTYNLDASSDLNSNVQYTWTGPGGFTSTEASPAIDQGGIYTCEVLNLLNNCSSSVEVMISEDFEELNASIEGADLLNCDNPSLELIGASDQDDVSYNWILPDQNQATGQNIIIETGGAYTILVTDLSSGCTATETVVVSANFDQPEATALGGEIDCQESSISLEANSDGTNVSYSWSGPDGFESDEQNPEVTEAGEYVLTVMAGNGCSTTATAIVSNNENTPDADIETASGNTINCITSELVLTGTSSVSGVEYTWTHEESGDVNSGSNLSITEAGTYSLLVIDPTNGCTEINSIEILTDFEEPELIVEGNTINCYQSEVSISATSGDQVSSVTWTGPNYNSEELEASNVVEPGLYTVMITSALNGCTSSTNIEVVADIDEPTVVANSKTITCNLTEVPLSGIGSSEGSEFSYSWETNNDLVSTDLEFMTTTPGTYTLNILNRENGCRASTTVVVDQNIEVPIAEAGDEATLTCSEDSETLNASSSLGQGDLSYSWINQQGAEISTASTFNTSETGTFTLLVTDMINGCTASDVVNINQDINAPTISFAPSENITCDISNVTLDASASQGQGSILLEWTNSDGNIIGSEPTLDVNQGGVYQLTIIDLSNDCMTTSSIEVAENLNAPAFNIMEPQEINCSNGSIEINLEELEASDPAFVWTGPNNFTSNQQNLSDIQTSGEYTLTITDQANGCVTIKSVEVLANVDLPIAEANVNEELNCTTTELNIDASNSSAGLDYSWTGPSIISGANTLNPLVDQDGNYILTIVNPENGCESTTTVMVNRNSTEIEGLDLEASDVNCFGDGIIQIQEVISGTAPYLFSIDNGNNFTDELIFEDLESGAYNIVVQDGIGCEFISSIEINPAIDLYLDYTSTAFENTIQVGQSVQLLPENNFEIEEIFWSDPSVSGLFPFVSPESTTTYIMSAFDKYGCVIEDEITIFVESNRSIFIPTGFSPNGDGINDNFIIFANMSHVQQVEVFQVFDRWGVEVFSMENFIPNDEAFGWDGTFKDQTLEPGVYLYYAVLLLTDGETSLLRGEVTIVR